MPDPEPQPTSSPTGPQNAAESRTADGFVLLAVPLRTFHMGQMVITANANAELTHEEVKTALMRHSRCDWGDVCDEDKKVNERGVRDQGMILSSYQSAKGVKFWVITDPGHEVTTVLLPEDY